MLRFPSVCLYVCPVGVPKSRRGEVWLLLSQQYRLRHRLPQRQQPPETPYQDLLKQLTAQQHAILVDLGLYLIKYLLFVYRGIRILISYVQGILNYNLHSKVIYYLFINCQITNKI